MAINNCDDINWVKQSNKQKKNNQKRRFLDFKCAHETSSVDKKYKYAYKL